MKRILVVALGAAMAFPLITGHATSPRCSREYGTDFLNAVANRQLDDVKQMISHARSQRDNNVNLTAALALVFGGTLSTTCQSMPRSLELFNLLVHAGADVNGAVWSGYPSDRTNVLYQAAREGDVVIATAALKAGAKIESPLEFESPLSVAVRQTKTEIVELFLAAGANPSKAMIAAARSSDPSNRLLKLLIRHGAKYDRSLGSPLNEFARFYVGSDVDAIERLKLLWNFELTADSQPDPTSLLLLSLKSNSVSIVVPELFLQRGAKITLEVISVAANTPQYENSKVKRKQVFELLFRYGLDPELKAPSGSLALQSLGPTDPKVKEVYFAELRELLGKSPW
jgi:ankyrin repeat protein